ncbi:hypothetical protein D1AOALGA4SA_7189 [Olavius algarvensis Delta 1 endosymbiont]|nr:hypothetical protein D1AOALGA4SA_7189 [Olavius algarvensis Delta 1 endosymbiont]
MIVSLSMSQLTSDGSINFLSKQIYLRRLIKKAEFFIDFILIPVSALWGTILFPDNYLSSLSGYFFSAGLFFN